MSKHRITFFVDHHVKGLEEMVCLRATRWMPFVPRAGDWIAANPCDDFREVESVYWCHEDGVCVHFKTELRVIEPQLVQQYLTLGWVKWPEQKRTHKP